MPLTAAVKLETERRGAEIDGVGHEQSARVVEGFLKQAQLREDFEIPFNLRFA
jgi:hypothetical protein